MNETLHNALNEISDRHIAAADGYRKHRRYPYWFGAVAAVLAVVILASILWHPDNGPASPASLPSSPQQLASFPMLPDSPKAPENATLNAPTDIRSLELANLAAAPVYEPMVSRPPYDQSQTLWLGHQQSWENVFSLPEGASDNLAYFFTHGTAEFLSGEGNQVCSPINIYLAMAMAAECAGGQSRQEILDLFGVSDIETLRNQASFFWHSLYNYDGQTTSLPANSLWLDDSRDFNAETVQLLANSYFASVFHGDLGSKEMNDQLHTWLNAQTDGLLSEQVQNTEMDQQTVMALVSSLLFKADWEIPFNEKNTINGTFYSPAGEQTVSYMRRTESTTFYQGYNFQAIALPLSGGNSMWLFLPSENVTPQELLRSSDWLHLVQDSASWKTQKDACVRLSLPKFDITYHNDLVESMQALGLMDIFDPNAADFSPICEGIFVRKIDHAARVMIDEDGIAAAAFTFITYKDGGYWENDRMIELTLDRPFLFVVSSRDDLPLFVGTVQEP